MSQILNKVGTRSSRHQLEHIADVVAGIHPREFIKSEAPGPYIEIQIKHLIEGQKVAFDSLHPISLRQVRDEQLVKSGDILFIGRGDRKVAILVENAPPNVIVGAQIFIIRVHSQAIDPGYLAWFLNQNPAQTYVETYSKGVEIKNLGKAELQKMPIFYPTIEKQRLLVEAYQLRLEEEYLIDSIEALRTQQLAKLLIEEAV